MDKAAEAKVRKAQDAHQRALEAAQSASAARSMAVALAHRGGASYALLGEHLGISKQAVIQLAQKGERLLAKDDERTDR